MNTIDLLIATVKSQIDTIADNALDIKTIEDHYDYTDHTDLEKAIYSSLISTEYAKNNFDKLSVALRLMGAEMLLQSEGYAEIESKEQA